MNHTLTGIKVARVSTIPFFVITQLKSQLDELLANGVDLTVIASKDEMADKLKEYPSISYQPISIRREIAPLSDMLTVFKLWWLFRKEQYSVVHSTTPKAGLLSAIAALMAGVPVRLHTFTGQPWVTMKGYKRRILRFCDWLMVRLNTRCYADSPGQCDFLVQEGVDPESKIKLLGKGSLAGVNLKRFDPLAISEEQKKKLRQQWNLSPERPVFLFMGRITEDKGVFELLEASEQLLSKGYQFDVLIAGPFEQFIEKNIRDKASKISKTRIQFTGFCEMPEEYFAIADVLCLPSYREGFGTVVIEAAAMGIPTIGTNIYGLSDAIVDGETGLLVEPRSVEDLANAMQGLLDNPQLCKQLGRVAKDRAVLEYDSKILGELLVDEYRNLLVERK